MNILFDFRVYEFEENRGIGRYIYSLVDNILKNFPEIKVSILKFYDNNLPKFNYRNSSINYYFYYKLDNYNFNEKFDFYFFDDMLFSTKKIKSVNTFFDDIFPEKVLQFSRRIVAIVYDLIPLIFDKHYLLNNSIITKYFLHLETLYVTDHLFAISECTKNDFVKYLNIDENKITNIYGGYSSKFNNFNIANYSFRSRENNIVFIGGADIRKNINGAIKAFSIAYNSKKIPKNAKLYICCKLDKDYIKLLYEDIKKYNLSDKQIIITGFISDDELIALISNSKFTIFPSFYEGLGMPILESYASNTPCFASNLSSIKELILQECSFNPYDENDIANAIINGFNNEELCNKSIKFGKYLIENKCNWDIASKKVISKLYEIIKPVEINTAVFGVLPPENSGIANYNAKSFGINSNFHIFSRLKNYDSLNIANSYINDNYKYNFIPIEYYSKFIDKYVYKKNIFVLGNSHHNLEYLRYAIKEKNKEKSYLYLHEINLLYLLLIFVNNDKKKFIDLIVNYYNIEIYKILSKLNNINDILYTLLKNKIYGAKIIISITQINNVIVNNNSAKELLLYEMKDSFYKINLIKMFLPVENLTHILPKYSKNEDVIYIGSFGMPNDITKSTNTIIKAVDILNNKYKKHNKIVILLLAGYGIEAYVNAFSNKELLKNIIYYDSPDIDTFLSIMKSVDLSIQLRNNLGGETSGVISQLLGMNKKIITTDGFVDYPNIKNIKIVNKNITSDELSLEILSYLDVDIDNNNNDICNFYSYESLCNNLLNLDN